MIILMLQQKISRLNYFIIWYQKIINKYLLIRIIKKKIQQNKFIKKLYIDDDDDSIKILYINIIITELINRII